MEKIENVKKTLKNVYYIYVGNCRSRVQSRRRLGCIYSGPAKTYLEVMQAREAELCMNTFEKYHVF